MCHQARLHILTSLNPQMDQTTIIRFRFGSTAAKTDLVKPFEPVTTEAPQPQSDQFVIEQVRQGSREALAALFRRHCHAVHNIGRRILRDDGEADDLVQDVFLYIHRKACLFDSSKSSARSWIFQIAYTQALLRSRKLKRQSYYASGIPSRMSETDPRTSAGADYEHTVEGIFGQNGWRNVLESLTEEQRETLRLHFFEGYTFPEIAEKLGQSYANVRNHHYRGLEKLRRHFAEVSSNRR
jgi:RNA polymerase sigma-70 factor, ECF subfamily